MSNYYKVTFKLNNYIDDAADLLAAFLADVGYESFENEEPYLIAYIKDTLFDSRKIEDIISSFPIDGIQISWKKEFIEHQDWNEEWEKKYFKPLVIGGNRCVIHSTFHSDYPEADYEIIIDPKMAFGTGHHATTTMMVEHLFDLDLKGQEVVDMGTGTGILAILAKKLGARNVYGIEIDPGAYQNAVENALLNHTNLILLNGDVGQLDNIKDIDYFLANINRNVILADIEHYVKTLKPQGKLILSGFYKTDVPILEASLKQNGMEIAKVISNEDNWTSLIAIKK